jgi:hypothetical protein
MKNEQGRERSAEGVEGGIRRPEVEVGRGESEESRRHDEACPSIIDILVLGVWESV